MCGIIGLINQEKKAASDLYIGLLAMQHRGKESACIVTTHGGKLYKEGKMGEVPEAINSQSLDSLVGRMGIAHVRYSTFGLSSLDNIQPIKGEFRGFTFYIAHNGNLVNANALRKITGTNLGASDTRLVADLISISSKKDFDDALIDVLVKLEGSFNFVILFDNKVYAVKDRFGFHPLQVGIRDEGHIIASESCVFDMLNASLYKEILPGTIYIIDEKNNVSCFRWFSSPTLKIDIFEYIYFLLPPSIIFGAEAGKARYLMGKFLSQEHPCDADVVVPIPDSGNEAALGYYEGLLGKRHDILFRPWALFRSHIVSRTFIEPVQELRKKYLNLKFDPRFSQLCGKKVVFIDDSIVRGNTAKKITALAKKFGAKKVCFLSSSPMYLFPDFYGIDTYRVRRELIAQRCDGDIERIRQELEVDYVGYLSLEKTIKAVLEADGLKDWLREDSFYTGPFTGIYPAGTGDFSI